MKINIYNELNVYAKRMIDLMDDPGFQGCDFDVWENNRCWVVYDGERYIEYYDKAKLEAKLELLLLRTISDEIKVISKTQGNEDYLSYLGSLLATEEESV